MAVKHVKKYFLDQEALYFEMLDNVADFEQGRELGWCSEEMLEDYKKQIDIIKSNYERLAYIMLLLNQPNNDKKEEKYKKQNKLLYNRLENASDESVKIETMDAFKKLKELMQKENKHD